MTDARDVSQLVTDAPDISFPHAWDPMTKRGYNVEDAEHILENHYLDLPGTHSGIPSRKLRGYVNGRHTQIFVEWIEAKQGWKLHTIMEVTHV